MQADWKKLVAYSSVSHLGSSTLGIFSMNPNGIAGSVLQQVNHGISTRMRFLSMIAIIYGALVSLMQADWKKLVAYSSVSHLGFCTLGIFSMNPNGIACSVLQQVN